MADAEVVNVDAHRLEQVELLEGTRRTALVRRVGEDGQPRADMRFTDRTQDLALLCLHGL